MSKHNRIRLDPQCAAQSYDPNVRDRDKIEIGVVKFFDPGRGFGFVTSGNAAKAVVFRPGAAVKTAGLTGSQLEPGTRIEYVRVADKNKRADCAVRIKLV